MTSQPIVPLVVKAGSHLQFELMSIRTTRARFKSVMEDFNIHLIAALQDPSVIDSFQKLFDKSNKKTRDAITELQNIVVRLINKLSETDKEISDLKHENQELREELDELQQYSRKPSIRVYGIPESEDEDTDQLLLQLFNERMQLEPPVQLQDIEISHRVGRTPYPAQSSDKPSHRAIIARFASRRIKAKVMREKKKLKQKPAPAPEENDHETEESGTTTNDLPEDTSSISTLPIFISDDLTRRRARLAKMARDLRRRNSIRDTWVFDGRIMIKDNRNMVHEIIRESDFPQ